MGMAGFPHLPKSTTNIIKEFIMSIQTVIPRPTQLTDQPVSWPLFYLLPQTHYVKRQRAANSPEYYPRPKAEVTHYEATSKKQTYYQRCTQKLTAARNNAWASLKQAGRKAIRKLMRWCLLPLAIAACFAMVDVAPAELPADYYAVEDEGQMER
jgi:hypothetical protein